MFGVGVCVLFIYTISISILCVSQKKPSFTAFNWVTSEKQDIVKLCKVNCYIRKLCIPYNTHSCCEHIAGCDNMYLYGCLSLSAHVCAVPFCMYCLCVCVCVCVCVCAHGGVISNHSTNKKPHYAEFSLVGDGGLLAENLLIPPNWSNPQ